MLVMAGDNNVTSYFVFRKISDGLGATGLDPTDFWLQYIRSGEADIAGTAGSALAAIDSAHSDHKCYEVDTGDTPGLWRVDWPDAAFVAGAREVILSVFHAATFVEHLRVQIDAPVNVTVLDGNAAAADTMRRYFGDALVKGTADSGTVSTLVDADRTESDDCFIGWILTCTSGANAKKCALITDFVASTDTLTFTPPFPTGITTENYVIEPVGRANIDAINNNVLAAISLGLASGQILPFTVTDTVLTPTTVTFECADITHATTDIYNGRTALMLTGAMVGRVARVTGYTLEAGNGRFVTAAMPSAVGDGDTGILL